MRTTARVHAELRSCVALSENGALRGDEQNEIGLIEINCRDRLETHAG